MGSVPKRNKGLRINRDIRIPKIRVIDENGNVLGVMQTQDALKRAEDVGLDLIEVAPNAEPPTCKIMDYGRYKYEQKKKAHESKKKQVSVTVKEIQLRPRTEQHDLDIKLKHVRRFLEEGAKAKINLRFRGREMVHQEGGFELLERVIEQLKDCAVVVTPPQREGRQAFLLLAPEPNWLKERKKALKVSSKQGEEKKE